MKVELMKNLINILHKTIPRIYQRTSKGQRCKSFNMCFPQRNTHVLIKSFYDILCIQTNSWMNMIKLNEKAMSFGPPPPPQTAESVVSRIVDVIFRAFATLREVGFQSLRGTSSLEKNKKNGSIVFNESYICICICSI